MKNVMLVLLLVMLSGLLSSCANMHVESNPSGADVTIGRRSFGKTPTKPFQITGSYPIMIEKLGYKKYKGKISVMDPRPYVVSLEVDPVYLQKKLKEKAEETRRKAQKEIALRESNAILAKMRSRGYGLAEEVEKILVTAENSRYLNSDTREILTWHSWNIFRLNVLVLESLLPFSRDVDSAIERGDVAGVNAASALWRGWLKRSQSRVSEEVKGKVKEQLAYLDSLDRQFADPVSGSLSIKLSLAIKEERWEDAKNIQAVIAGMTPAVPVVVQAAPVVRNNGYVAKCKKARSDYASASATYNSSQRTRSTRRTEAAFSGLGGMVDSPAGAFNRWISNSASVSANTAQQDMNHSLALMRDAQSRISVYCRD